MLVISFQNCAKTNSLGKADGVNNATDISSEKIGVVDPQSAQAQPQPRVNYVIPRSIDFGFVSPIYQTTNNPPPQCQSQLNYPNSQYAYSLNLMTGKVTDTDSGDVLLDLSAAQKIKLKAILNGSIITSPWYFLPPNAAIMACVQMYVPPYANLRTNRADFELGSGSPGCAQDLYKRATGQLAGLQEFLEDLEAEFGVIAVAGN